MLTKSPTNKSFLFGCRYQLLMVLLLLSSLVLQAQLRDSLALDTTTVYTSLTEALKNPNKVIKLELKKNKLKVFPTDITQFKNLQYLDLSKNSLKELPSEIGELTNLQYLILSKNKLSGLPKEIGNLKNLKSLNVNQNELVLLPPQIGQLDKLEYLDLWSNNLNEFPQQIGDLKQLKVLDLRVIIIDDETQHNLESWLPKTKIYFSPNCRCK